MNATPHPATAALNGLRDLVRQLIREELKAAGAVRTDAGPRELRRSRGLEIGALAAKAGVSDVTISKLENGRIRKPKIDTLNRLGRALGCGEQAYRDAVNTLLQRIDAPTLARLENCSRDEAAALIESRK